MKIEAGKRYVTRDGRTIGPMERDYESQTYIWDAPDGNCYTDAGEYYRGQPCGADLVAEYTEPVVAVDANSIREGDIVLVRMKVSHYARNGTVIGTGKDGCGMRADPDDIVSVEPRPLAVGDRVRNRELQDCCEGEGELRFIDNDGSALVRSGDGISCVWRLSSLVRA